MSLNNIFKENTLSDLSSLLEKDELTKKHRTFHGTIIEFIEIENSNYLNLNIKIGNEYSNEFISLKVFSHLEKGYKIIFTSNDIKVKLLKDKNYIELSNIQIEQNIKNEIGVDNKMKKVHFNFLKFVYTYDQLLKIEKYSFKNVEKYIYSIILKVHLIEVENSSEYQYEFRDIFGNLVYVNYSSINKFIEGQKIYIFNSFLIENNEGRLYLTPTKFATVTPIDDYTIINQKIKIEQDNIVSLKGKIDKFNLVNEDIEIIDEEKHLLKIKLNNRLLKKISLGCPCDFKCFIQKNNDLLEPTEFSEIIAYEKTSILFNLVELNRYYDQIIIDDKVQDITDKNMVKVEIKPGLSEKNQFVKNIKLRKKEDIKVEVDYNLEIDRGKVNTHNLYLGKDGKFAFQIYNIAKNEKQMQKEFNLKIGNEDMKFSNFDTYENKLRQRITFINIPTELYKIDNSDIDTSNENKNNSFKVLNLINKNVTELKFRILNNNVKKENINYEKMDLKLINSFYDDYFIYLLKLNKSHKSIASDPNNKYHNLFYGQENIEIYMKYLNEESNHYIYNNNEKDYNFIKKLCFAVIYYNNKNQDFLSPLINYCNNITQGINKLEFDEAIKCLISLASEYKVTKNVSATIDIVRIDQDLDEDYNYIAKAHKLFIEIINDLKETDLLFLIIQQFNSIIYKEMNIKEYMYSGSILNVNDVKLEIYKNLNSFYLCSYYIRNLYAAIFIDQKVTVIYPNEFLDETTLKYTKNDEIENRKTSAVLILLFHELGGHLKTHINNENDSPRRIYLNDLEVKVIELKKNDSGFLLEYSFAKGSIEVDNFINSENSSQLLNKRLYLDENFEELSKTLTSIDNCIKEKIKENKDKIHMITKSIKYKDYDDNIKKVFKSNYKNLNYAQLTNLLYGMDDESLKEYKEIYNYYISKYFSKKNKKC